MTLGIFGVVLFLLSPGLGKCLGFFWALSGVFWIIWGVWFRVLVPSWWVAGLPVQAAFFPPLFRLSLWFFSWFLGVLGFVGFAQAFDLSVHWALGHFVPMGSCFHGCTVVLALFVPS